MEELVTRATIFGSVQGLRRIGEADGLRNVGRTCGTCYFETVGNVHAVRTTMLDRGEQKVRCQTVGEGLAVVTQGCLYIVVMVTPPSSIISVEGGKKAREVGGFLT